MKKCPYCGLENPEHAVVCSTCQTELDKPAPTPAAPPEVASPRRYEMSPDEQRFWDKMTFRQFAVLVLRIQSVWFFFNALIDLTYLPRYFPPASYPGIRPSLTPTATIEVCMLILRIALYVGAGVFLIQATERILHWLVKDCIPSSTP